MGLLERVQMITSYLREHTGKVKLSELTSILTGLTNANIIAVNDDNEVLAKAYLNDLQCEILDKELHDNHFTLGQSYFINVTPNVVIRDLSDEECLLGSDSDCAYDSISVMTIPLLNKKKQIIRIVVIKFNDKFDEIDQIFGELICSLLTMERIYREVEFKQKEYRRNVMVEIALDALSYSEIEAAKSIFKELGNIEGFLVASKVADKVGITRSVIVNALRKLESAGVIESRSLGMKGTYIKVLNEKLLEQLNIES
jgi:transcriptional pleiotropic repressor